MCVYIRIHVHVPIYRLHLERRGARRRGFGGRRPDFLPQVHGDERVHDAWHELTARGP